MEAAMRYELAPFALPEGYAEGVLPLVDVKRHCAIEADETEFDVELAAYRDAGVDMVEKYTGLILAPRTGMVWRAEALPSRVRLGVKPVTTVMAFTYLDSAGDAQTGDHTTLRIVHGNEVVLKAGESWPSDMAAGVALTFSAGLAASERPAALVQAARMFTAHLFAHREAVITGTISGEIPLGVRVLCDLHRAVVI
jgi:uncharacterized phiE125 gp8 family phage protein